VSNRSQAIARAIEVSQDPAPAKPRVKRKREDEDPLSPEEQKNLRLLAAWPGEVARSPMGYQLELAERIAVGVQGGNHLIRCRSCVDGWVRPEGKTLTDYRKAFAEGVDAWAAQRLGELRRAAERNGEPFDEEVADAQARQWGLRVATEFDDEHPPPGRVKCGVCQGSCLVVDPCIPPSRADQGCPLCLGTGRHPFIDWRISRGPDGKLKAQNFQSTRRCRCIDQTVNETGNSVRPWTGTEGDGPDPERMAQVGRLLRRILKVELIATVAPNVRAAMTAELQRPGIGLSLALGAWYSPVGEGRLECLWPLSKAGSEATVGLDMRSRGWRATTKDRVGGTELVEKADKQAEVILGAARTAWEATRNPEGTEA
jgi:hypothetical protein